MLDLLLELGGDLIEGIVDFFTDDGIKEVLETGLLISGAIVVTELTVESIQSELKKRQDLKRKGAIGVWVDEVEKREGGATVISATAFNAMKEQVAKIKMEGPSSSGIKKGDELIW